MGEKGDLVYAQSILALTHTNTHTLSAGCLLIFSLSFFTHIVSVTSHSSKDVWVLLLTLEDVEKKKSSPTKIRKERIPPFSSLVLPFFFFFF